MHAWCDKGVPWPCSSTDLTYTTSYPCGGGSATPWYDTSTLLRRPLRKVWRFAWSDMGTLRSIFLSPSANAPEPQVWTSSRPYFWTCGWPIIVYVWTWNLNTIFTHHMHSIISSSIMCRPYNSQSRCSGVATKTCGAYGQIPVLHMHVCQWAHI